jgi:NAD(P)-dependent dehydrogenase (short-subunit alcohol dehydrogenase family)
LINNAGRFVASRHTSVDGYELTFATNHLNYFLLTYLLLDIVKASGTPECNARIVNVASGAHHSVSLNFDDLQNEREYRPRSVYGQSKLMNIMFTYELARRLAEEEANVMVNAVHPGFVRTGLGRDNSGLRGLLYRIALYILRPMQGTAEEGAQTLIYAATSPEVEGITGKYFADCQIAATSDSSMIATDWVRLWKITENLVGLT